MEPVAIVGVVISVLGLLLMIAPKERRAPTTTLCPECRDCREVIVVSNNRLRYVAVCGALLSFGSLGARLFGDLSEDAAAAGFIVGIGVELAFGIRSKLHRDVLECARCRHRRPADRARKRRAAK